MGARSVGVVWFRRDLRLGHNPAFHDATANHDGVVALFVLEPALLARAGGLRRAQLLAHLGALHQQLVRVGGGLTIRKGPAVDAVGAVLGETEAGALYLNSDTSPFSTQRDQAVIEDLDVPIRAHFGNHVHEPGRVLTNRGTLSKVFTPFYKTWTDTPLTPWPEPGAAEVIILAGDPLPNHDAEPPQAPGEDAAWARLTAWLERVDDYPDTRDLPGVDGTSQLSADLKFGTLAARAILDAVGTSTPGRASFVRQLAWRDWYAHMLRERPDLPDAPVNEIYANLQWRNDPGDFEAWAAGQTGFPIVDAGMRQLLATGWMHNRVRMICASFLVKDLLVDWRKGERFFRHHLVDADVSQNAGNWQWVAGTGPDAAPYFRVFNPTSQSEKFDPDGAYIRRWVPELAALDIHSIHQPDRAAPLDLAAAGVTLGDNYPYPIVDHAFARERALASYKAVRESS